MRKIIFFFFVLCSLFIHAQPFLSSLSFDFQRDTSVQMHVSFKPYVFSEKNNVFTGKRRSERSLFGKIVNDHWLHIDTNNFYLTVDPIFNFELGRDLSDTLYSDTVQLYKNTRGVIVNLGIGDKLAIQTSFTENQVFLPSYAREFYDENGVLPGSGRIKRFKYWGFDYSLASSYISYSPTKRLNLQLGQGKHHLGNGYRSLFLSDFSNNYPYLRADYVFGKRKNWKYTKLHASFINNIRVPLLASPEALYFRKTGSIHYVSWHPVSSVQVGFFESTLWQSMDSSGTKPFNFMQVQPVPGLNTMVYGSDSRHYSSIGFDAAFTFLKKVSVYSQVLYEGRLGEAYQLGVKYEGKNGLRVSGEFNKTNGQTYKHNNVFQSYSHFNQPLGYFLSREGIDEWLGTIWYRYKRGFVHFQSVYREESNTQVVLYLGHIGYTINKKNNMSFMLGMTNRQELQKNQWHATNYLYLALRTRIGNSYYNF